MHYLAILALAFLPVCAIASDAYARHFGAVEPAIEPIDYSVPYLSTESGEVYRIRREIEQMRRDSEFRAMQEQSARDFQEFQDAMDRTSRKFGR
jgi:hypothetical protein